MTFRSEFHESLCNKSGKLAEWYCGKTKTLDTPIYSSYDIRDAGFKISNVDANIFPAGFNNICPTDKEGAVSLMSQYLDKHYGTSVRKILLVTEEHTNNPFYWENVLTIQNLLKQVGREVIVGIPRVLSAPVPVQSSSGQEINVVSAFQNSKWVQEFKPDLVI